jgi:hypothetical protein
LVNPKRAAMVLKTVAELTAFIAASLQGFLEAQAVLQLVPASATNHPVVGSLVVVIGFVVVVVIAIVPKKNQHDIIEQKRHGYLGSSFRFRWEKRSHPCRSRSKRRGRPSHQCTRCYFHIGCCRRFLSHTNQSPQHTYENQGRQRK